LGSLLLRGFFCLDSSDLVYNVGVFLSCTFALLRHVY
jgi:hypothetical protein